MEITVQGTHRILVTPERAEVRLTAAAEFASRERAVGEATKTANRLGETLIGSVGVDSFRVEPVRVSSWRPADQNGRRLPDRVLAQVDIAATFTDFSELAAFTALAGTTQGVSVGGVTWSVTDSTRDRLEEEVLREAITRARRRALAMAKADGGAEVEIVEVADPGLLGGASDASGGRSFGSYAMKASAEVDTVDIVPEQVEVAETVHVRFRVIEKVAPPRRSQR